MAVATIFRASSKNIRNANNVPKISLVVEWSESLTTNHEVLVSIPGSTVGIFLEGEDSRGDHGLGRLVEFRFKAPPGPTSSSITTHTSLGQRNCASWASQPQESVAFLPWPGGRATNSTKRTCGGIGQKNDVPKHNLNLSMLQKKCPKRFMKLLKNSLSIINPLNAELNPICHLLALLGHHIFHVSGLRVKIPNSFKNTPSNETKNNAFIYIYIYIYIYMFIFIKYKQLYIWTNTKPLSM